MSAVNELVRDSIAAYPSIFKSRWDVLHHVLCVNGNGYFWTENGSIESESALTPWSREAELTQSERDFDKSFFSENFLESRIAENEAVINSIEERVELLTRRKPVDFYPQSEYSLLLNAPEEVAADWAEAVEFFKNEASLYGWVI